MTRELVLQRITQAVMDAARAGWSEREKVVAGTAARTVEVVAMAAVANAMAGVAPELERLLDETAEATVRQAAQPYELALMGTPGDPVDFIIPAPGSPMMLVWMTGLLMGLDRVAGALGVRLHVDGMLGHIDSAEQLVDAIIADILRQAGADKRRVS